mgnify:CR=1 FL=1
MAEEFYGTLEGAAEYHAARNNTAWEGAPDSPDSPDDYRMAALIRASDYIDATYRARFSGSKVGGRAQMREWPRIDAVDASGEEIDDETVPIEIERATYEAALRELEQPGSLSPDFVAAQQVVRERVEGAVEVQYSEKIVGVGSVTPVVSIIDGILSGLLTGGASTGGTSVSFFRRA